MSRFLGFCLLLIWGSEFALGDDSVSVVGCENVTPTTCEYWEGFSLGCLTNCDPGASEFDPHICPAGTMAERVNSLAISGTVPAGEGQTGFTQFASTPVVCVEKAACGDGCRFIRHNLAAPGGNPIWIENYICQVERYPNWTPVRIYQKLQGIGDPCPGVPGQPIQPNPGETDHVGPVYDTLDGRFGGFLAAAFDYFNLCISMLKG